jgi:hypothetical protein
MLAFGQGSNTKVVGKILFHLHAKFHIFLRSLSIFFQLLSHLPRKSKRKREFKIRKSSRAIFSMLAQRCSIPAQTPHVRLARYHMRTLVAATRGPPVGVEFPSPLPCSGRSSPPARFWPNCDTSIRPRLPHATPPHPLTAGRRLRAVPSCHLCCIITVPLHHCVVAARSICRCQELDDEASRSLPC